MKTILEIDFLAASIVLFANDERNNDTFKLCKTDELLQDAAHMPRHDGGEYPTDSGSDSWGKL